MPSTMSTDLAKKAEAMQEFRKFRDAGLQVPPEVRARHVAATNEGYATGPDEGQRIPAFSLPDQNGAIRSLEDLARLNGLLLVFHRSANWCQYCRTQLVELESCPGRYLRETVVGWRRLATILKRPSPHSRGSIRLDTRFFPIALVRLSGRLAS
jgi:hypothetical protein